MFILQQEKVCPKDKDLLLTQPVAGVIGASFRFWHLDFNHLWFPTNLSFCLFFCLILIYFSNQRSFYHGGQHFEAFPGESANMINSLLLAESEKTTWVYGEDALLQNWHSFLYMCKQNCFSLDSYLPFHSFTSNSENKPEPAMQTQSNTTYQVDIINTELWQIAE